MLSSLRELVDTQICHCPSSAASFMPCRVGLVKQILAHNDRFILCKAVDLASSIYFELQSGLSFGLVFLERLCTIRDLLRVEQRFNANSSNSKKAVQEET